MKNWVYKTLIFIIIFSIPFSSYSDSWFGRDKLFHFITSCIISIVVAGPLNHYSSDPTVTMGVSAAITLTLGIAKEYKDMKKGSYEDFSYKDLTYDIGGLFLGLHLMNKGVLCAYW